MDNESLENSVTKIPEMLYGKVLQGGLGVGKLTSWILDRNITELVTIEINENVIYNYTNTDKRHTIVKGDFNEYCKEHASEFDFIVQDIPKPTHKTKWIKTGAWQWAQR